MKYMLDTNTCIRYLNGSSPSVFERLNAVQEEDICVCSVVQFELRYGALHSEKVEKNLAQQSTFLERFVSLPFDSDAQLIAADIRAMLAKQGTPIGPYDLLIAAITIAHELTLITHNIREFKRMPGLKIEDWEDSP
jgi:tRNA(fMet)-specific endonuclease VapC